MLETDENILLN